LSQKGVSASEWSAKVSEVVGGKAGGKAPTSFGNGIHGDKVDEAVEVATKYLEKFNI
jgi:alanyl-tRNA synthetase